MPRRASRASVPPCAPAKLALSLVLAARAPSSRRRRRRHRPRRRRSGRRCRATTSSSPRRSSSSPTTDKELRKLLVDASRRRVGERDRHHRRARGRGREGERDRRASRSRSSSRRRASSSRSSTKLDPDTRRQLLLLKFAGASPSPDDPKQADELAKIATEMTSIYGKGRCARPPRSGKERSARTLDALSKMLAEEPQVRRAARRVEGLARRRRPRRARPVREVRRAREQGRARRSASRTSRRCGARLRHAAPTQFEAETDRLWDQVKPLYDELHCYARRKLRKMYGDKVVAEDRPDPGAPARQHVGAGVGQPLSRARAVQGRRAARRHAGAREEATTRKKMVKLGEAFFTSLGLDPLPKTFWERSLFTKPDGREVVCHASAWDVDVQQRPAHQDVHRARPRRISSRSTTSSVTTTTSTHYYKLPMLFQSGANDGFHEAIGDTLALSITPAYLKKIGLLDKVAEERQGDDQPADEDGAREDRVPAVRPADRQVALGRVLRRRRSPTSTTSPGGSCARKYQGVAPPVARAATDFDPGAKYHVAGEHAVHALLPRGSLQFQFHRALCKTAGYTGPLHACSIYGNKEAGAALQAMLALGASKPWPEALVRAHRRARDGRDRDPRVLRAAAEVAQGAEQGPDMRLVS